MAMRPHPPWYDTIHKKSGRVQGYLERHNVAYVSDFYGLKSYSGRRNEAVKRALWEQAQKLRIAWRASIPTGKDGTDGHFQDQIKIRSVQRGGDFKDRSTYEVYIRNKDYWPSDVQTTRAQGKDTWAWQAIERMSRGGL